MTISMYATRELVAPTTFEINQFSRFSEELPRSITDRKADCSKNYLKLLSSDGDLPEQIDRDSYRRATLALIAAPRLGMIAIPILNSLDATGESTKEHSTTAKEFYDSYGLPNPGYWSSHVWRIGMNTKNPSYMMLSFAHFDNIRDNTESEHDRIANRVYALMPNLLHYVVFDKTHSQTLSNPGQTKV